MDDIETLMKNCRLCPRNCGADRLSGKRGYCGAGAEILVARAALHMWEEPCISGSEGSGAVFFSGCSLGCVFCQNRSISRGERGEKISAERLAQIMLELQDQKANNINLVTAGHFVPQIAAVLALLIFRPKTPKIFRYSLLCIFAGGLGNLIDRLALGYVRDFIDYTFLGTFFGIDFAIGNIADIFVMIALGMLIVYMIFGYREGDFSKGGRLTPQTVTAAEEEGKAPLPSAVEESGAASSESVDESISTKTSENADGGEK